MWSTGAAHFTSRLIKQSLKEPHGRSTSLARFTVYKSHKQQHYPIGALCKQNKLPIVLIYKREHTVSVRPVLRDSTGGHYFYT